MDIENYDQILKGLKEKASLKQLIYRNTLDVFNQLKNILEDIGKRLKHDYQLEQDSSVEISFKGNNEFEVQLKFSGDILLLSMHSNVFNFESSNAIYETKYIKDNPSRSYCGVISFHNFLADSVKYNRLFDTGDLVARILVNKDNHFIVESEQSFGFLSEDFSKNKISKKNLTQIIEKSILACLHDDLTLQTFANDKTVTLKQKQLIIANNGFPTGKKLGYQFKAEINPNADH